jgi:two-component system, OmpR family, sensor histidine kinase KdpD
MRKEVPWSGYLKGVVLVILATSLCQLVRGFLAPTNLMMIYLLSVVMAATKLGRRPAVMTALLGVLAFDFFFVPPRFTFGVTDAEYFITFFALFTVGVIISTLVSQARERAESIREREEQTASLYYLSRDLAVATDLNGILAATLKNIEDSVGGKVAVLIPEGEHLELRAASDDLILETKEHAVADWAFRNSSPAGRGTETLISADLLYLPLQTSGDVLGVLGVRLKSDNEYGSPLIRRLLQAFATQTAFAIERVLLVKQAQQAQILQARESLERALLNSISHDLRTPLVSITGALGALRDRSTVLEDASRHDLLDAAWEEAGRLNRFVDNLLDMTRLEAGALKLKRVASDIQDLVGCALAALEPLLAKRKLEVRVQPGLPLVSMDMVLMTQVLVNLLDNALKYAPRNAVIELDAAVTDSKLTLDVADRGPGVPTGDLDRIFDKFYRVPVPEGAGGTGLGLSICKGIVEAHGGSIRAENREGGGLRVTVLLPIEPLQEGEQGV